MTVTGGYIPDTYAGDGSTTVFAYTFRIFADGDLLVELVNNTTAERTTQILTTDYTVSNAGEQSGGNVTFVTAPASGYTVVISRLIDVTQETEFPENGRFPAISTENALDKLTMISQAGTDASLRSIKLPVGTDTSTISTALPVPLPSEYLKWNDTGTALISDNLDEATLAAIEDVLESAEGQALIEDYVSGLYGNPVDVDKGGTGSATGELVLPSGASARTISVAADTSGAGVGTSLTMKSGGAQTGSTDNNGGQLILSTGSSTGSGASSIVTYISKAGTAGTDAREPQLTSVQLAGSTTLTPHGTSAGDTHELRLQELAAGGTDYVGFKAPDAISTSTVWTLPSADGTSGQFLRTTGSHVLEFATPPSWNQIANQTVADLASVDLDLPTTGYTAFRIVITYVKPIVDASALWLRFRAQGGSYLSGASDYGWYNRRAGFGVAPVDASDAADAQIVLSVAVGAADTSECASMTIDVRNSAVGGDTFVDFKGVYKSEGAINHHVDGGGRVLNASILDQVRIMFGSGNIDIGVVSIYGYV